MKVSICDPCKAFDQAVTPTDRYMKVKGKPGLRLDICDKHGLVIKKMSMADYVRYVYKTIGIELTETDQEITKKYLGA